MGFSSSSLALFILVAMGHFPKGAARTPCLKDWVYNSGYCYGIFFKGLPWRQAELQCQDFSKTAHLVSIHTKHEAIVVDGLITATKYKSYVWIGFFGVIKRGWWIDDTDLTYIAWGRGQPKYSEDLAYYCGLLSPDKGRAWEIADCDIPYAYICKYKPS